MISIIHNKVYSFYYFFKNNATLSEQFQKECHIAGTFPKRMPHCRNSSKKNATLPEQFQKNTTLPEQFQKQCHIAGTDPKSNIKIVVEGAKIQMFSHSPFWLGIGALIKRWQGQINYMSPNLPDHATDSLQTKSPR